jgi:hypothetical protein
MTDYEFAQQALEMRAAMEGLFMLGLFGEIVGVPIIPPYYGLRLLPFVVPQIETWKRQVLRERELGSDHEHHLHGLREEHDHERRGEGELAADHS